MREEGRTTLLYKNIYVFLFFRKELKLLWFVRQMDSGTQDRLLYWPITSLDYSMLCYLQDPLSTSSASRPGLLNQRPGMGHNSLQAGSHSGLHCLQLSQLEANQLEAAALSGVLSLTATGSHSGFHCLPNWLNCCRHLHILFHNALLLPIRSHDLLPLIYTGVSWIDGLVKGQYVEVGFIAYQPSTHFRLEIV